MSWFSRELDRQSRERERSIALGRFPQMPRGFRPADVFGGDSTEDGFVPLDEAASEMGVTEDAVVALVRVGQLEASAADGTFLVRPAIVSTLAVRGVGMPRGSRAE